jgi:2-polyprenyl-3-methyl-5-hydroxy-6-metoxy-1,4-benzoquinol methylase
MGFKSFGMKSFTEENIHDKVIQFLKNEERGVLLDIGAGTGALSQKMLDEGFNVMACDLNPHNFIPKQDIACKQADLNNALPYEDKTFNYVVGTEVIEHLENPWYLIRELHRITKENAIVILSTPNLHNWYVRLLFLLTSKLYNFLSSYEKIGHITPIFIWNLERMAKGKFQIVEVRTSHSLIPVANIPIPLKGLFWGQCVVVKMKREKDSSIENSYKWYNSKS